MSPQSFLRCPSTLRFMNMQRRGELRQLIGPWRARPPPRPTRPPFPVLSPSLLPRRVSAEAEKVGFPTFQRFASRSRGYRRTRRRLQLRQQVRRGQPAAGLLEEAPPGRATGKRKRATALEQGRLHGKQAGCLSPSTWDCTGNQITKKYFLQVDQFILIPRSVLKETKSFHRLKVPRGEPNSRLIPHNENVQTGKPNTKSLYGR
ncbi:uncharacterized protein LOC119055172 isoform X2 [Artibeus jamaicensis]|uniref:uncharacterized protein LOC119055172 isoform X2 n=1 Tax=Artibeus jamaicensis TaxID=9417 RepID=UPI00235A6AF7|nr:uncharacterized protein LOC119055172 isoform X2 [Artibeus jamaicensis]